MLQCSLSFITHTSSPEGEIDPLALGAPYSGLDPQKDRDGKREESDTETVARYARF